ncbi:hypothetical protein [Flavobacterium sp. J27]|uniref:hypothetical protein n=1 Tax=Flavobacterium sp. J27 TaxID=2060419 RepID=UPI0010324F75|nr:hypothetical protein [Flavobacterium sp. J27]
MDKIKQSLEYIQNHLNVILLVPTVLGGFWQLIELMIINTSYVRFFSLTQVVADGIIILFILGILTFSYLVIFSESFAKPNSKDLYGKLWLKILSFLVILIFIIYMLYEIIIHDNYSTILFIVSIILIMILFKVLGDIVYYHFKRSISKFALTLFSSSLILIFASNIDNFGKMFHKTYFIPDDLKNIENIECYLGKKKNEFEILYLNDNYIFVKVVNSQQVEIIKFEELLNKENCE